MAEFQVKTDRLLLRGWRDSDRASFAALNRDPVVMEFLGSKMMTRTDSDAAIDRQIRAMKSGEPAFWAVEHYDSQDFIGCIGVKRVRFKSHFTPAYEIGWRLAQNYWGKGYATEAARASLKTAFKNWDMNEVYSFTVPANIRSQAVMRKIGMQQLVNGSFNHPKLPLDNPLSKHIPVSYTHLTLPTILLV